MHTHQPLADTIRPTSLDNIFGQDHLTAPHSALAIMLANNKLSNIILWGPAGSGKTTLARIIAAQSGHHIENMSAVINNVADLRKLFATAAQKLTEGQRTVLLVDEIHRFNRAQQDIFLPHLEDGTIILIGATTENPSFELISPLLSRCTVFTVHRLDATALNAIITRAEQIMQRDLSLTDEARQTLCLLADGDGRYLLNMCEELFKLTISKLLTSAELVSHLQKRFPVYDKNRDEHHNLISALHKALRGSDCDAALYWLNRMLVAGEDPLYIARRLIRCAIEDIGLADPQALTQALAAKEAYDFIGSPEGELALAQAVIYLATAPKSNASYNAYNQAKEDARNSGSLSPPKHILNAPTKLMRDVGYGKDYIYDHQTAEAFSGQNYFPDKMQRKSYYHPVERGFERDIKARLEYWNKLRKEKNLT